MQLETERYSRLFQKDGNNYILKWKRQNKTKRAVWLSITIRQFHNLSFNTVGSC